MTERLNFSIHAALPPLQKSRSDGWILSPEKHGQLLVDLLERYLENLGTIRISTLDQMCRSISVSHGSICTFDNCLGKYFAIAPNGAIYPCQRFIGFPEYQIGNVSDFPSMDSLRLTNGWRVLQDRQERVADECGECPNLSFCRGGCAYNALVANGGNFSHTVRDPHCLAYRQIFDHVVTRALDQVFSEENLDAVINNPDPESGLLRKGQLLSLMRGRARCL
jgi:uncharacterized protein